MRVRFTRRALLTVLLGGIATFAAPVQAQTLVGNLGLPQGIFGYFLPGDGLLGGGFQFNGVPSVVTSLVANLDNQGAASSRFGEIRADAGGTPQTGPVGLLGTFSTTVIPTGDNNVTFTPSSAIVLQPGVTYWFLLGASGARDSIVWRANNSTAATDGSGSFNLNAAVGPADGSSFTTPSLAAAPRFQINGIAAVAPEPCSLALAAGGLLTLAVRRRRRRR
jgi:hypothetical protein